MLEYELDARFDRRKSFYGKALIREVGDVKTLISYSSKILRYNEKTNSLEFFVMDEDYFTHTTCRHINEFLRQFTNFSPKKKKELLEMAEVMYVED